jgi:hypothetical protein
MTYKATLKVHFDTEWTPSYGVSGIYDDASLPEEHYTFEIPTHDINSTQLFHFFATVARTMGHNEVGIMKGACALAFNDMRSEEDMRKVADEFELKMVEDYAKELRKLEDEIYDLKAKLSRCQQPDNPNYTDEEIEAMTAENQVTAQTLKNAQVVCHDCGDKYGTYSVGCSSTWEGKCGVCGETKSVTEVRDYAYLTKGIKELSE